MQNFTTARATLDDLDVVAHLFDLYRQFYAQKPDPELALHFIRERIKNSESVIFLALENGQDPIGFCQLYPTYCSVLAKPILVLYDLFVVAPKRKTGVGRSLLMACENYANSTGASRLDLTTAKDNYAAQSLYESMGWERDRVFLAYNRTL
jgi:ribosomal protein S18 acetylase RimI-like enzyme